MNKINLGSQIINYPMPVSLVGTMIKGTPNFMTVAWLSMVSYSPPKLAVILGDHHFTNQGIKKNKTFSVCFPSIDLLEKTDYAGIVSGEKVNKSQLFQVYYGDLKTAPLIDECPLCVECKLDRILENGVNEMFIGDISGVFSEEKYLKENRISFEKINPLILSQNNAEYWSLGQKIADAWSIGKNYQ